MPTEYFKCPISDGQSLLIAIPDMSTYQTYSVARLVTSDKGLRVSLCHSLRKAEKLNNKGVTLVDLQTVDESEIPEDQRVDFSGYFVQVGRPWGGNFMQQLECIVSEFGLTSVEDPYVVWGGGDCYAAVAGASEVVWEIEGILQEQVAFADKYDDIYENEERYAELEAIGNRAYDVCYEKGGIYLHTDWKHFEIDVFEFEKLGIEARFADPEIVTAPDGLKIHEVVLLGNENYVTYNILFNEKVEAQ